jgi:hypothetical protein
MERKKTGMVYTKDSGESHEKFKYYYEPKGTIGDIEIWPLCELSKYESLIFSAHADVQLDSRDISKQQIQEFFEVDPRVKVVWRPGYKSHTGLDARVVGELKGVGLITVIIAKDLTESGDLMVHTAHQVNHSKNDLNIYYEGLELLSKIVEEENKDEDDF